MYLLCAAIGLTAVGTLIYALWAADRWVPPNVCVNYRLLVNDATGAAHAAGIGWNARPH